MNEIPILFYFLLAVEYMSTCVAYFLSAIALTQVGNAPPSSIMTSPSLPSRSLTHRRSSDRSQTSPSNQIPDLVVQIDNLQTRFPNSLEPPTSPALADSPRSLHSSL